MLPMIFTCVHKIVVSKILEYTGHFYKAPIRKYPSFKQDGCEIWKTGFTEHDNISLK